MQKNKLCILVNLLVIIIVIVSITAGCSPLRTVVESLDSSSGAGGTLRLWDSGPLTLDPAISSEMSSHTYVMQIFSGLVKFDSELKPAPDVAEKWEVSEDGKTYTFYLRQNVKFHDGKKVTAADIKYSLERACNPQTGSQTASIYLNDIVGVKEVIEGKATQISGLQIIDDYTLKINIDAPKAYFLSKLAYPTAFVVDKKNVESGKNWWQKPNGTGPLKLTKWNEGALILLAPNQYYYGQKATVNVAFYILAGIPMSLYERDKIDVVEISKSYIDRATDEAGPFYDQLHVFPEFSLQYIGFNTGKPPFDDPMVRQAFCYAVDKEQIIKLTQKDMVAKASGIIPPGMPGYNKDVKGLDYDPEKARQLLAKSRYGSAANLPPITVTVPSWGGIDVEDYLGAVILDWKQNLGVNVSVRLLESNVFHYNLREEADEMYVLGWIADYPDPQNFLYTLFYSGTEYNYSHFSDKQLDALLDGAALEKNYEKRTKLYQQAEQMVVDAAPVMPLWFSKNYMLIKSNIRNFEIDPLGVPRLHLVTVEH
ncbi:MAG: peptide ABC transporter substrate-binding protein [Chloroflexi bacterium]|nr:peptide ABC transporter substrate-binding protein [Chloroflexota bacterium]